jgi:hypothetical protein
MLFFLELEEDTWVQGILRRQSNDMTSSNLLGALRSIYPSYNRGHAELELNPVAEIIFVPGFETPTNETWTAMRWGKSFFWPESLPTIPEFQQTRIWTFEYERGPKMLEQSEMGMDKITSLLTYWLGFELEKKSKVRYLCV